MFRDVLFFLICLCTIRGHASEIFSKDARIIILLGAPGAGKGTQAALLSKAGKLPHISTGDIARENIRLGTPLGKIAKLYNDQGKLAPDQLIIDMLFKRIIQLDCKKGFILDGFPRTLTQAKEFMRCLGTTVPMVLNLRISDAAVIKRLSLRLTCKKCGQIYNKILNAPKKEMVCDVCQGALYQRADDTESVIKTRLLVYHKQSEAVSAFFDKQHLLISIDATKTPEAIHKDIQQLVDL